LSQDINPSGARLDFTGSNYFPAAPGDNWTYNRLQNGVTGSQVTRTASAGTGTDVVITETAPGSSDITTYRRTSDGIVSVNTLAGSVPSAVSQLVGNLLEFPEPFYPVGAVRRIIRQGNWGEDLDGDGVAESYRLEISQVLVGLETLTVAGVTLSNAAHFRTTIAITVQPSSPSNRTATITATEETWWAPGIGLARADRSIVDGFGVPVEPAYSIVLTDGSVGGRPVFALNGTVIKVALIHNDLVFDRTRNVYYASVPGAVATNGNSIATLNAATGTVSFASNSVGSEPSALAISTDGSALYVGLNGSGDVVKLRLPDMTELWRVRLPIGSNLSRQLIPARIAASPVDTDVVAVSMAVSPFPLAANGGVALIRAGVLQAARTPEGTGISSNSFGANGLLLYSYNNGELRRSAVIANGLNLELVTVATIGPGAIHVLDRSGNALVVGNTVYRTPDLALLGQINVQGGGCRSTVVTNRLVCIANGSGIAEGRVALVDATSLAILATPLFDRNFADISSRGLPAIVPGTAGQVALSIGLGPNLGPWNAVWLFASPALQ
jgi:hypothetical protein